MQKTQLTLVAAITNKCDKTCSFCFARDDYMQLGNVSKEQRVKTFTDILDDNPQLTNIAWSGGEPLLEPRLLREMFDIAKTKRPDITNTLFTNGISFRLKDMDIYKQMRQIRVSIDGYSNSERNLIDFVHGNKYEAFEVIKELDQVMVKSVITYKQLDNMFWYEDIIKMHQHVHHLGIQYFGLALDHQSKEPLTMDQAINLIYGHSMIDKSLCELNRRNGFQTDIDMEKMFLSDKPCKCYGSILAQTDGTIGFDDERTPILDSGCSVLAESMGIDVYSMLNNVFNVPFMR